MSSDLSSLDYLNDKQDEMVQLTIDLCNVNSGTLNVDGVRRVAQMLADQYRVVDCHPSFHSVPDLEQVDDGGNLIKHPLGPLVHVPSSNSIGNETDRANKRRPHVVLCIHTDTVYDKDHHFQSCRWVNDETVNGPGVSDAKGGQVVMLYALKAFQQSPWANDLTWEVIMNPDEELGSPGSTNFLQQRARQADFGLLFEPSLPDGTLVSWRKGSGNFHFVVRGIAAHSGRDFEKGRNAIAALSEMLVQINNWNGNPDTTFNVARISGGGALNTVPDLAVGRVNVRVKTQQQLEQVNRKFSELVAQFNTRDGISVEQHGQFRSVPKTIDQATAQLQTWIQDAGHQIGLPVRWKGTGGASDGNKMAAVGLPNIDTMGPQGGNIHSPDEFLLTGSLVPRAKLAALTLIKIATQFQ